jgi:hypothetical protein
MNFYKLFYLMCFMFFLAGCSNRKIIYVYSPNKKQCITIITNIDTRYIINGKHKSLPKKNYIKYSLDSIDVEVADEIVGHWKNNKYEWEIATDKAIILENKLDSKRFKFNTNFPTDDNGMPTIIDFTDKNSYDIGFDNGKIINFKGVIIN